MSMFDRTLEGIRNISDPGQLQQLEEALRLQLKNAPYPRLSVEEVTDDGETWTALRCPECGSLVDEDDLRAVDTAERWTQVDWDGFDFERHAVTIAYDGGPEWESAGYYLHDGGDEMHRVRLPEGWREDSR